MKTVARKVRDLVVAREDGCCAICGAYCLNVTHSVHHRRTKGSGGSTAPDTNQPQNLLLVCGDGVVGCHAKVTDERRYGERYGYRVPQGHDPLKHPVRLHGMGWVLLTADGAYEPTDAPDQHDEPAPWAVSDV